MSRYLTLLACSLASAGLALVLVPRMILAEAGISPEIGPDTEILPIHATMGVGMVLLIACILLLVVMNLVPAIRRKLQGL